MKTLTLFLLCAFFGTSFSLYLPTMDCGSKKGSFSNISLSCSGSSECILKRNQNITMSIEFTPSENVREVTAVAHGVIEGLPVPFPLPNPNACKDSGLQCPLRNGQKYKYYAKFFVKKSYPKVRVNVRWELRDENGEDIVCVLIPARIQST